MSKTKNMVKTGISIDANLLTRCDASIPLTNAQSRSEFICEAIEYYIAVLHAQGSSKVLTPALESVVSSKIALTEDRISRMIFKLAVEVAMLNHQYAAAYTTEEDYIDWLREHCKHEVSKLNGRMNLNDIANEYVG
jgi:metal-responsive CopG/Arc/MetJ family transcriptional regulator